MLTLFALLSTAAALILSEAVSRVLDERATDGVRARLASQRAKRAAFLASLPESGQCADRTVPYRLPSAAGR